MELIDGGKCAHLTGEFALPFNQNSGRQGMVEPEIFIIRY